MIQPPAEGGGLAGKENTDGLGGHLKKTQTQKKKPLLQVTNLPGVW